MALQVDVELGELDHIRLYTGDGGGSISRKYQWPARYYEGVIINFWGHDYWQHVTISSFCISLFPVSSMNLFEALAMRSNFYLVEGVWLLVIVPCVQASDQALRKPPMEEGSWGWAKARLKNQNIENLQTARQQDSKTARQQMQGWKKTW